MTLPSGAIVVANREAHRIHDLNDGLHMARNGRWHSITGEATAELSDHIAAISSTAAGEGGEHEIIMLADRKSGKQPFIIELVPLRDALGELERGLTGAIMFIIDPENQRAFCTERFATLFALTEAETDVCRHMLSGCSALEIAEARGVSEGTVRTQFKAIYEKTGVHRRAELIRLAVTVDPPIERPK